MSKSESSWTGFRTLALCVTSGSNPGSGTPPYVERIQGRVQAVFLCTNRECWNLYISTYERVGSRQVDYPDERFTYRGSAPWIPEEITFPMEIEQLSPQFVRVVSETRAAEGMALTNLVGMGMRKSLEFLIKDFAICSHSAEEEMIRKMPLSQVIERYCDSAKVKQTASRAAWLGNDESHYDRIWVDKDVEDLKILIRLTVSWIESELLTKQYTKEMPDKKT